MISFPDLKSVGVFSKTDQGDERGRDHAFLRYEKERAKKKFRE